VIDQPFDQELFVSGEELQQQIVIRHSDTFCFSLILAID
jgi:hypothetical protein